METAWEGRPCGPKGCKGRKSLLLSSKHKWQSWKSLFPAPHPHFQGESLQTQISKLTFFHLAQTNISELEIFVSPKPKYPSWKHFTPDHIWKLEEFVSSTDPNYEMGSIRLSGCPPKTPIPMFRFWKPKFQRWKHELSVQNTFSKFNRFVAGARPKFQS